MDFFAAFCLFLAFFAGFGLAFVWQWQIKRTALSIVRGQAGEKGRKAQAEQENELMMLITDAAAAFKDAKANGIDMKDAAAKILPALAAKYPNATMKFGKKLIREFGKGGGLEFLEGLF
mgnify:CR=1 FL=1|jgi:hypothetical protein